MSDEWRAGSSRPTKALNRTFSLFSFERMPTLPNGETQRQRQSCGNTFFHVPQAERAGLPVQEGVPQGGRLCTKPPLGLFFCILFFQTKKNMPPEA